MEKRCFYFSYFVQKFSAFNFFGWIFAMFARIQNQHQNFSAFFVHISTFANVKANAQETTKKNVPSKCAFELFYASVFGMGHNFDKKNSKIVYNTHLYSANIS